MSDGLTRRSLFPVAGLAPFGLAATPEFPQMEPLAGHALRVVLTYSNGKWLVCVPDYESMNGKEVNTETFGYFYPGWKPGMAVPYKWVPVADYLAEVEQVCGISSKA